MRQTGLNNVIAAAVVAGALLTGTSAVSKAQEEQPEPGSLAERLAAVQSGKAESKPSLPAWKPARPGMAAPEMTDETWAKALKQNSYCKMQEIAVTSRRLHYKLDCDMRSVKSQGDVDLTFDGPAHMIGKSTMTTTMQGKTMSTVMQLDYRWKGAACSDVDRNIKKKSGD